MIEIPAGTRRLFSGFITPHLCRVRGAYPIIKWRTACMGGFSRQKEIDIITQAAATINRSVRRPASHYMRYLRRADTQSREMRVDGSVTPVTFEWIAPEDVYLLRISGTLVDGTINLTGFMGLPALANGITLEVTDANENVLEDFTDGENLTVTTDLSSLSTVGITVAVGNTNDLLVWSLAFDELGSLLYLRANDRVRMTVQDDLTGLSEFQTRIVAMSKTLSPKVIN